MASNAVAAAANHKAPLTFFLGMLALALLRLPDGATCIPIEELDAALAALRSRGYNLAANSIAVSNLRFDLLSAASLTLFAPVNSALFALGVALPAPAYLSALRSHAVPRRLSAADLRRSRYTAVVPTFLPSRTLRMTESQRSNAIAVDGVEVAVLGIFYGRNVAVHGLRGALTFPSQFGAINGSAPHPVPRRHSSSIFFRVPRVASPSSHVNDADSSPLKLQESYSPLPWAPPSTAPGTQPLSTPAVAQTGEDGDEGYGRGRYGFPGKPVPAMMPPFNGGTGQEGSFEIFEPFDDETIDEVFEDDNEFWDDDFLLA